MPFGRFPSATWKKSSARWTAIRRSARRNSRASAYRWRARSAMESGHSSSTTYSSWVSSTAGPASSLPSVISKARSTDTPNVTSRSKIGSCRLVTRSGASLRPDGLAQAAGEIAQDPKRQCKIIFTQNFPAIGPLARNHGIARHVPAIVLITPNDPITGRTQVPVFRQVGHMVFDQDQLRLPARDVEPAQHLDFMTLDVDRQELECN